MTEEVAVTMASSGTAGAAPAGGLAAETPPGGRDARPGPQPAGAGPVGVPASGPSGGPGSGRLTGGQAARPQLIRELNEQLLLSHIRQLGPCSRADLARLSGLSKPTVSLALANV